MSERDDRVHRLRLACEAGDTASVARMLAQDVVAQVELPDASTTSLGGAQQVATRLVSALATSPALIVTEQAVNGESGLVLRRDGRVTGVVCLEFEERAISNVWLIGNPQKLLQWNRS